MKPLKVICVSVVITLTGCGIEGTRATEHTEIKDTVPPVLFLQGLKVDTIYLQPNMTTLAYDGSSTYTWNPGNACLGYEDKGVAVLEQIRGQLLCTDIPTKVEGIVNTKTPGTYYLHYTATDTAGNKSAVVTRTVHVLENPLAFLNGNYDVVCTTTLVTGASLKDWISTNTYTAVVYPKCERGCFELVTLNIGPERVIPATSLDGHSIQVSYFGPEYVNSSATGTLSASKNSFAIESTFCAYSAGASYLCKNVYTKREVGE
jgi:hypothetical protein